jgi:hypothetical protein
MNYPLYITEDGYLFALIDGILTDGAECNTAVIDTAGRVCFQYTQNDVFALELFEDSKTFSAARVESFWSSYNSIINL